MLHKKDKALVERSVELVYQRIYYPLSKITFFDLDSLNKAIAEQLIEYNNYLFSHGGGTRRSYFIDLERDYLYRLVSGPYSIRYYKRAKVQRTSHIFLSEDKNYYSVPFRYTGMYVEVQYNQDIVEILYNHVRIASHERSYRRGNYKTIAEHMPSTHQAYGQWSPEYFEQRATQVGPSTLKYIQMLLNQSRYPEIAYKQSLGILSFVRLYSPERLEKACVRASTYHKASFHTVSNILKNRLDMVEEEEEKTASTPEHGNIRGAASYR